MKLHRNATLSVKVRATASLGPTATVEVEPDQTVVLIKARELLIERVAHAPRASS
jgi:hypothetical protein